MKQTIIAIDNSPAVLEQLRLTLSDKYKVVTFTSGSKALDYMELHFADLVILDILIVDMDGFEIFRKIRKNLKFIEIPIIFLSSQNNDALMLRAYDVGAADYIVKPFVQSLLARKVSLQMELVLKKRELLGYTEGLEAMISAKTHKIELIQGILIRNVSALIEYRDGQDNGHIFRTEKYMKALAEGCLKSGLFSDELDEQMVLDIISATPLHDVGKVIIPDYILQNPGKLSDREYEIMKSHTVIGAATLGAGVEEINDDSILDIAKSLALYHHERFDGGGYPTGTSGKEIPICARLMSIVDVYDALISEKPYRPSLFPEDAVAIINDGAGEHFDPDIVKIFNTVSDEFENISRYQPVNTGFEKNFNFITA